MLRFNYSILFVVVSLCLQPLSSSASVIDAGDLTIIDQAGNASDGLRYLDLSYGRGLSLTDALTAAQAVYANARIATAAEWDDLFEAAGIIYNSNGLTASSAFDSGASSTITSSSSSEVGALRLLLGNTLGNDANIWSTPDGDTDISSTRDLLRLTGSNLALVVHTTAPLPSLPYSWLIVSEASSVPEPTTWALLGLGLLGFGFKRRRNQV